jgi:hypothetical protein
MLGAGVPRGRVIHHPVSGLDWYATIAELAGVENSTAPRSVSVMPMLRGEGPKRRFLTSVVFNAPGAAFKLAWSVQLDGDWTFLRNRSGDYELYAMSEDPCQTKPVPIDPTAPEFLAYLALLLELKDQGIAAKFPGGDFEKPPYWDVLDTLLVHGVDKHTVLGMLQGSALGSPQR